MGLRDWVKKESKKAKRKIEGTAKKAGKAIDKTANKAAQESERIARDTAREAENLAKKLANEAREEAMSVIDDIKNLEKKAKKGLEDVANKAKNEVQSTANKAVGAVESAADKAKGEVEEQANIVKREMEALPEKIEDELQDAFAAFAKSITAEGLRKVRSSLDSAHKKMTELREAKPDLVDAIDEVSFYVEFGPVKATYASFYSRSEGLSHVLSKPPDLKRSSIVEFFRATVPTSIDFGLSVQVVALVVGSKELGIGGGMGDIPGALAVELLDVILEAAGVPE